MDYFDEEMKNNVSSNNQNEIDESGWCEVALVSIFV